MYEVDIDYLIARDLLLQALEAAGVDNWEGYAHALTIYGKYNVEEDDE